MPDCCIPRFDLEFTLRIAAEMQMTVAFVCIRKHETLKPIGTAFLIGHMEKQDIELYVVTARHVIDEVKKRYAVTSVFVTFNGVEAREEREIPIDNWSFHPDPGSDYIDVAAARFSYNFATHNALNREYSPDTLLDGSCTPRPQE